jgi:hypothetical protein
MEKERIIVNLYDNENFTLCNEDEVEKSIERAKEFYAKDVELYEHHLIYYPNMKEHWERELSRCKSILAAGFEAITFEEYENRMREKYLSKTPTEITEEEFDEALNVLPPLNWVRNEKFSMFFVSEALTLSFYSQYLYDKTSRKYYCATTDICDRSTWLDKMLNL